MVDESVVNAAISTFHPAQLAREQRRHASLSQELWEVLDKVSDPEIPVLSIWDLGVLQDVSSQADGSVHVTITPTYSGCPAMREIERDIVATLTEAGYSNASVEISLEPTWTTDWMTAEGRRKLKEYGIAPPAQRGKRVDIRCPQCDSPNVSLVSEFSSTACKALYKCGDCAEPFDYFKCI